MTINKLLVMELWMYVDATNTPWYSEGLLLLVAKRPTFGQQGGICVVGVMIYVQISTCRIINMAAVQVSILWKGWILPKVA